MSGIESRLQNLLKLAIQKESCKSKIYFSRCQNPFTIVKSRIRALLEDIQRYRPRHSDNERLNKIKVALEDIHQHILGAEDTSPYNLTNFKAQVQSLIDYCTYDQPKDDIFYKTPRSPIKINEALQNTPKKKYPQITHFHNFVGPSKGNSPRKNHYFYLRKRLFQNPSRKIPQLIVQSQNQKNKSKEELSTKKRYQKLPRELSDLKLMNGKKLEYSSKKAYYSNSQSQQKNPQTTIKLKQGKSISTHQNHGQKDVFRSSISRILFQRVNKRDQLYNWN